MLEAHTDELDDLIFNIVKVYASMHDVRIDQQAFHEKGKIIITIEEHGC